MKNYQMEVTAYTKGLGRLICTPDGYDICHNAVEVIEAMSYDSERDLANPTGFVFAMEEAFVPHEVGNEGQDHVEVT